MYKHILMILIFLITIQAAYCAEAVVSNLNAQN
jgi:hypothetical protein